MDVLTKRRGFHIGREAKCFIQFIHLDSVTFVFKRIFHLSDRFLFDYVLQLITFVYTENKVGLNIIHLVCTHYC